MPPLATSESTELYIDLMKRVLTDLVHIDSPLAHLVPYRPKAYTPAWKRTLIATLQAVLRKFQVALVEPETTWGRTREDGRLLGRDWPARAHTMIGLKRLDNLQYCVETVMRDEVPGDLIETGVWRGGACIFMRALLKAYGDRERRVWVADSFQGLPTPNATTYTADADDRHHTFDLLAVSREQVEQNFTRYDLLDAQVQFLQGWFKDTLPTAPITQLAVLRLDGDMYESTIQALEALYDRLSPGGFVIIDDYQLKPCVQAVRDFRTARQIAEEIRDIDGWGAYWRRAM